MKQKTIMTAASLVLLLALVCAGCKLEVNDPVRAVPIFQPYISVQPASHSFKVGDDYASAFPLEVEVWDWDKLDGSLSYQWRGFTRLEDYYKGTDQVLGSGNTFTPSNLVTTAGARNYYYAVVTNSNPDAINGPTRVSVKSNVAIISFYDDTTPAFPEIAQNPGSASYTLGRANVAPLDVRATVAANTDTANSTALSYQWYSFQLADGFDTDGNPKGTLIPGAQQRTYLPSLDDLAAGDNYYYVVVSNVKYNPGGDELGRASQYSAPATITMKLGEKAEVPRIDRQPRNLLYFTGATLTATSPKLSVEATSIDRGGLSYQWYSTTSGSTTGAGVTPIQDATSAEYLPEIATGAAATARYFVIVKNTNNNVTGSKEATSVSKVVTVQVAPAWTGSAANLTVTVKPDVTFQYIRGYGGMEVAWANFPETSPADTEKMYNPDQLGYNILRIMIPPSHVDIEEAMSQLVNGHRPSYYENAKIVNKHNGYILASPWSPPREWKSNNSINGGGILRHTYYKQYAAYLRSFARHMSGKGAPIYAISIQNEPNYVAGYDGCEWTGNEMRDFYKEVGRFTQGIRGWGSGRATPTVLTVNGESANTPEINFAAIDDPVSFAAIDLFARHVYGEQTKNLWNLRPKVQQSGKEVWMTEHNINSASSTAFPNDWTWNYIWRFMNDVDLVMRLNNENAFVWWASKRFYSYLGDGEANTVNGSVLPRGWGLAHYSKFTIDTTRIGADITGTLGSGGPAVSATNVNHTTFDLDNVSARITAYESQDGNEISLVIWTPTQTSGSGGYNLGTVKIQLPAGFIIRSAAAMRSNQALTTAQGSDVAAEAAKRIGEGGVSIDPDRNSAYVTVPASTILSVKFIREIAD